MRYAIPYVTTVEGAEAATGAIEALRAGELSIGPLRDVMRLSHRKDHRALTRLIENPIEELM